MYVLVSVPNQRGTFELSCNRLKKLRMEIQIFTPVKISDRVPPKPKSSASDRIWMYNTALKLLLFGDQLRDFVLKPICAQCQ